MCKLAEDAKAVAELASTQTSKDKTTIGEWKISIDEIKNQIVIDKAEMDKIKADVNTNKVLSENAATQTTEDKNAVHLDRIAVETVKQNVEKLGQAIQEATQSGVQMVNQSKQTAVSEISKTGNIHKTDVETAGTTAVQNIGTSKTDALEALETAKTDYTSTINSEGAKQTQAITTEGQKHLTTIQQTAQQAVANVNNAGQTQTERVQSAGNTAVESVKTEQGKATQAIETAKTEATDALQVEGTTQTGNVAAEGAKQVQAVQQAAQEIVVDREQIQKNKTDVTALKEDLGNYDSKLRSFKDVEATQIVPGKLINLKKKEPTDVSNACYIKQIIPGFIHKIKVSGRSASAKYDFDLGGFYNNDGILISKFGNDNDTVYTDLELDVPNGTSFIYVNQSNVSSAAYKKVKFLDVIEVVKNKEQTDKRFIDLEEKVLNNSELIDSCRKVTTSVNIHPQFNIVGYATRQPDTNGLIFNSDNGYRTDYIDITNYKYIDATLYGNEYIWKVAFLIKIKNSYRR